jgi:hypothetical protein
VNIYFFSDEEDIEGSITDHELNRNRSVSERDINEICKYLYIMYVIGECNIQYTVYSTHFLYIY